MIATRPELVTFDCGDTLLADWSPERLELLRREHAQWWVAAAEPGRDPAEVQAAFSRAQTTCRAALARGEPQGAETLARLVCAELGLAAGRWRLEELAALLDDPFPAPLRPAPGAGIALERLRERGVRLGVVSNTGVKSGRTLRRHLAAAALLDLFDPACVVFSDEHGVAKPDRRIYLPALAAAGCGPWQAVHVGDLRRVDVAGAQAAGLGSIRYTGLVDDMRSGPEADADVPRLLDVPGVLGL